MHVMKFYDSGYIREKAKLTPVKHLQCNLIMHKKAVQLLEDNNIVADTNKLTKHLQCVLNDLPEIKFGSTWQDGATTVTYKPFEMFANSNFGKAVEMVASDKFIPIVRTNEYSQQVMTEADRLSMSLSFRIYADSYNTRYRFVTTPYETWLRMLYFSTMPLVRSTYKNVLNNLKSAAANVNAETSKTLDEVTDIISDGAALLVHASPLGEWKDEDTKTAQATISKIENITDSIINLISNAEVIGQVFYDVSIPGFLNQTASLSTPISWIIKSFTAKPFDKFTRGLYYKNNVELYRPRPLYIDFNVVLESNQVVTREQYMQLLLGDIKHYKNYIDSQKQQVQS